VPISDRNAKAGQWIGPGIVVGALGLITLGSLLVQLAFTHDLRGDEQGRAIRMTPG